MWLIRCLVLVSSLVLLVIGVPRLLGELFMLPGTPIYAQLSLESNPSDDDLVVLEQSRLLALKAADIPRAYSELGAAYLIQANREEHPTEKEKFAEQSIEATASGLALSPLNTFAWCQLSLANILLGEAWYDDAIDAWKASVGTARFDPFVLAQRIHVGVILYPKMSTEERLILKEQVYLAYNWDRKGLRKYARQYHLVEWILFLGPDTIESRRFLYEETE